MATKKRIGDSQVDKSIVFSTPKRKQTYREAKSHNLTSLVEQSVPDHVIHEPSLESPPSSTFHECSLVSDSEMKFVKGGLQGDTNDVLDSKSASELNLEEPLPR